MWTDWLESAYRYYFVILLHRNADENMMSSEKHTQGVIDTIATSNSVNPVVSTTLLITASPIKIATVTIYVIHATIVSTPKRDLTCYYTEWIDVSLIILSKSLAASLS